MKVTRFSPPRMPIKAVFSRDTRVFVRNAEGTRTGQDTSHGTSLSAFLARDLLTLLKYLSVLSFNRFDMTLIHKIQGRQHLDASFKTQW